MELIKAIHVLTALFSIGGFITRGLLMLRDSPLLRCGWSRIAPHVNDSVLLIAGITLMIQTQQYPTTQPWLLVKMVALVIYIGLGTVAFRFGKTKTIRTIAWVCAIVVFFYIISVAHAHRALLFQ